MKLSLLLTAAVYVCAVRLQQRASNWTIGQTVSTTSGFVNGHPAANQSEVSAYLGIPFAQPPIGDLRFAAPVKYTGNSLHSGSSYGPNCPVKVSNSSSPSLATIKAANLTSVGVLISEIFGDSIGKFSEDCLYVNVWTKPQTGEAKKAVLVWIYGGAFTGGASSYSGYNGANIAELEDVVVVSFNYRLSILGFPGNPAGPNNLALLDQRLAVEWVRDNIGNFGGDASRITLFGQSAGAASIDIYAYAWAKDPIAAGIIPQSGTVFSWGLPNAKSASAAAWFNVSATLGCGDASSDSAAVLSCMQSKSAAAVLNAIPAGPGLTSSLGSFVPTVDDVVVFSNYSERTPAKLPILLGSNDYESGLFRLDAALSGVTYPDLFWDGFTLQEFTCPAGIRANASVSASIPTWRYRYFGVFPNTAISTVAGAYHSAENGILFDTVPSTPASTPEEISIENYMRGAWTAFAKDPVKGLTAYGWPSYNTSADTLIRLAYNNVTGTNAVVPSMYDADCIYVNVSSTNSSAYEALPTAGAAPTTTSTSAPTGSSTSSTTGTTAASAGTNFSGSLMLVSLAASAVAYLLGA